MRIYEVTWLEIHRGETFIGAKNKSEAMKKARKLDTQDRITLFTEFVPSSKSTAYRLMKSITEVKKIPKAKSVLK